jgi:hypothetical protein
VQPTTGGMKTGGLGVQPKARTQDLFSSGMLGLSSKRLDQSVDPESLNTASTCEEFSRKRAKGLKHMLK